MIDVNLLGPWRVTAAALPALRESRGRVINVASGLAYLALPCGTAYCMSKRGLTAYSDALRLEYGDEITVTTVYPGYIRTPIHAASQASAASALEGTCRPRRARTPRARSRAPRSGRRRATSRPPASGAIGYAFMRHVPRRLLDAVVRAAELSKRHAPGFVTIRKIAGDHQQPGERADDALGARLRAGTRPTTLPVSSSSRWAIGAEPAVGRHEVGAVHPAEDDRDQRTWR